MVAILFQMMQCPLNYDAVWLRQLLRIDRLQLDGIGSLSRIIVQLLDYQYGFWRKMSHSLGVRARGCIQYTKT
jgi:hypothetical protein